MGFLSDGQAEDCGEGERGRGLEAVIFGEMKFWAARGVIYFGCSFVSSKHRIYLPEAATKANTLRLVVLPVLIVDGAAQTTWRDTLQR